MKKLITLASCAFFATTLSAQTIDPTPYCLPYFDPTNNASSAQNFIAEVQQETGGTFDNSSTLFGTSSYVFYNNLAPITIHATTGGDVLHLTLVASTGPAIIGYSASVYIDYNHNNVFDSVEKVYFDSGFPGAASIHAPVPVPVTSFAGTTRMRIQWMSGYTPGPCQPSPSTDFGEIEDYQVNILGTYPIATTTYATTITTTAATLNGKINANGDGGSIDSFQYGLTTAYGSTAATSTVWELTDSAVVATISGLTAGTTYHYRVKGTNSNGTTYGKDTTFTTPAHPTAVANVTSNMNATVYPNPANDLLHIDNLAQATSYSILNITGATIKTGILQPGNNTLNIHTLPAGNYILELQNNQGEKNSIKLTK